jgi:hypothetical protein
MVLDCRAEREREHAVADVCAERHTDRVFPWPRWRHALKRTQRRLDLKRQTRSAAWPQCAARQLQPITHCHRPFGARWCRAAAGAGHAGSDARTAERSRRHGAGRCHLGRGGSDAAGAADRDLPGVRRTQRRGAATALYARDRMDIAHLGNNRPAKTGRARRQYPGGRLAAPATAE